MFSPWHELMVPVCGPGSAQTARGPGCRPRAWLVCVLYPSLVLRAIVPDRGGGGKAIRVVIRTDQLEEAKAQCPSGRIECLLPLFVVQIPTAES